jgi:hypothetical protein
MESAFDEFLGKHMRRGGRYVPARLQAALALLEKLRDLPSLRFGDHLAAKGSSGLKSHETFGQRVHSRLGLEVINKTHGRRSSNLSEWGQELLDRLGERGFGEADAEARSALIDAAQAELAVPLRAIIDQEPLEARPKGRSIEAVVRDLLQQAEEKGKAGDVAQYLVGAKLMQRFGREIPVHPVNRADRRARNDPDAKISDFEFGDAVLEVAVGLPDTKHIEQIVEGLDRSDREIWLLTRADRAATWRNELDRCEDTDKRRVVVTSVEAFIGQNITELGEFSAEGKNAQLRKLFDIYNEKWVGVVGHKGIRIVLK